MSISVAFPIEDFLLYGDEGIKRALRTAVMETIAAEVDGASQRRVIVSMTDFDRGAIAALDLLIRGNTVTEDETSWQEHVEGIRAAIEEGGLALAIRREQEFEATLDDPDFTVDDTYGPFPADLAAIAAARGDPEAGR